MQKIFVINIIIAISISTLTSCISKRNEDAMLLFKAPQKNISLKQIKIKATDSKWGLLPPTQINAFQCYAFFVLENENQFATCKDVNSNHIHNLTKLIGTVSAGETISINVQSGDSRTFGIYGFLSASGQCDDVQQNTFDAKNYSTPLLIGKKTVSIVPGDNVVEISLSLNEASQIESCHGQAFNQMPGALWPPTCQPNIANIYYQQSGQFLIEGSCLTSIHSLSLKNETEGNVSTLTMSSLNSDSIQANLISQFTLKASNVYSVIVNSAFGTTMVPLTFENGSIPINALNTTGATSGQVLKFDGTSVAWANAGTSSAIQLYRTSDNLLIGELVNTIAKYIYHDNYGVIHYVKTKGDAARTISNYSTMVNSGTLDMVNAMLVPSTFQLPDAISMMSVEKMIKSNLINPSFNQMYFEGSDCSGNVIVHQSNQSGLTIKGKYILIPSDCTDVILGMYNARICTTYTYKKYSTSPVYVSGFGFQSIVESGYIYDGTNGESTFKCRNQAGSIDGYKVLSSDFQNLDSNDPPTFIPSAYFQ